MADVDLKEYLERVIADLDKRVDHRLVEQEKLVFQRFTLVDLALTKAEQAMGARLNSMNEFRDALKDQTARMATRQELDRVVSDMQDNREKLGRLPTLSAFERLVEDVQELRRTKANMDGRLAMIAGLVSLAVGAAEWWFLRLK